jgi:hypothetical protein
MIEKMAADLPMPQRGLMEPLIQFVDMIRDADGNSMIESDDAFGPMAFLRVVFPMPMRLMHDVTAAIRLRELWPDLEARTRAVLKTHATAKTVDQAWEPSESTEGDPRLRVSVIVPLPLRRLDERGYDVAGEIMHSLEESVADQVRVYQVAVRLNRWAA